MARSGPGIAAIVESTALSPSSFSACGPGLAATYFAALMAELSALRVRSVIFVPYLNGF